MIDNYTLGNLVFENTIEEPELTFRYHIERDTASMKQAKKELSKQLHFIDIFEDFTQLGDLGLKSGDFLTYQKVSAHLDQHTNSEEERNKLKDFLFSEKGGKGLTKCQSLNYV